MFDEHVKFQLLQWKPRRVGSLRGFASVMIPVWDLYAPDNGVFMNGANAWAKPTRRVKMRDGQIVRDAQGRMEWEPAFWFSKDGAAWFSRHVIEAVAEYFPDAFD